MSHTYITVGEVEYEVRYDFYEGEEQTYEHQGVSDRIDILAILHAGVDIMDIVGYNTILEFERIIMNNYNG